MMEHLEFDVMLGIAQVSFIALVGWLVASVLIRIKGSIAASVGSAALVVLAILTFAMPFRLPNWSLFPESAAVERQVASADVLASDGTILSAVQQNAPTDGASIVAPLRTLQRLLLSQNDSEPSRSGAAIRRVILALMAVLVAFGFLEFTVGLIGSHKLLKASNRLVDKRANLIAKSIRKSILLERSVRLVESDRITSAAVAGWLDPAVLLPRHWREWTDDQLRCVLAHELAHVSQSDYVWRVASCFLRSIHYYNPLVHLFAGKLALAQEITADAIAASSVGQERYLKALSSLVLQQDELDSSFPQTGVHPVFSGYLIRRIKMLKSKPSRTELRNAAAMKWVGIATIMIVGGLTLASRGVAQKPPTKPRSDSGPVELLARLNAGKSSERVDRTHGMFDRKRTNLSSFAGNKSGFIKISMREILKELDSTDGVAIVNRLTSLELKSWLSSDAMPTFDVSAIDQVCGPFVLSTSRQHVSDTTTEADGQEAIAGSVSEQPTDEARRNALGFRVSSLQVECNRPVDISRWVSQFAPTSEAVTHEAVTCHVLPWLPALGPKNVATANRDPQTVCFSNVSFRGLPKEGIADSVAQLTKMIKHQASPNRSAWTAAFNRIDGGLISIAATNHDIRTPEEFDVEFDASLLEDEAKLKAAKAFHRIEHTFETVAFGIDLSDDARTIGIRVRIGCENRQDTSKLLADVQTLIDMNRKDTQVSDGDADDPDAETVAVAKQFTDRAVVDLVGNPDGTSDVYIRSALDLPVSAGTLLAQLISQEVDLSKE